VGNVKRRTQHVANFFMVGERFTIIGCNRVNNLFRGLSSAIVALVAASALLPSTCFDTVEFATRSTIVTRAPLCLLPITVPIANPGFVVNNLRAIIDTDTVLYLAFTQYGAWTR